MIVKDNQNPFFLNTNRYMYNEEMEIQDLPNKN